MAAPRANALEFETLFASLPGLYLILDRNFTICAVTEAYLRATVTRREAILGRGIFEVFPDNPEDERADGTRNLGNSLKHVRDSGEIDVMAVQKYDIPRTEGERTWFEERYWSPINSPVLGPEGKVHWIVHRVEDVTEYVKLSLEGKKTAQGSEAEVFLRAQEVQSTNERLKATDRAKTAFLAHMSHEIRTPLNAILGLSHLALMQSPSPQLRDYLTKIRSAGDTLLGLVNNILDLSKIESGSIELESIPLSLDILAERVRLLFIEKARAKGVELKLEVGRDVPTAFLGDPLRLGQVLTNLVGNALKFTETGQISLVARVSRRDGAVCDVEFTVRDTGIGMTVDQMGRLFQAFSQGDESMQRRYGGTGLGLRISQLIVQAMGGTISVESRWGEGSRFRFTIPMTIDASQRSRKVVPNRLNGLRVLLVVANAARRSFLAGLLKEFPFELTFAASAPRALALLAERAEENPVQLVVVDGGHRGYGLPLITQIKALTSGPLVLALGSRDDGPQQSAAYRAGADAFLGGAITVSSMADTLLRLFFPLDGSVDTVPEQREPMVGRLKGYKVLLAEDNEINRQIIQELLALVGVQTVMARDGREALDKILGQPPETFSLVLMDVQMPELDGYEVTRRVKSDRDYDALPIVALTAHALSEERQHSQAAGMDDHLTKPIDPDALYRVLLLHGRPPHHSTLDIEDGLSRVQGNRSLYRELLRKFLLYQIGVAAEIRDLLAHDDLNGARQKAHLVKGLALNLGFGRLGREASALEEGLTDPSSSDPECLDRLETAVQEVKLEVEAYLAGLEGPGPEASAPSTLSSEELADTFVRLLRSDDAEAVEFAKTHAAALYSILGPRVSSELAAALSRFDFRQALELWERSGARRT